MYYQNYHKHTSLSHRYNKDSSLVPMDYFKAMKPLADKGIPQIYSTLEHGWQGNYFHIYDDLEKFNKANADANENYKPIKFVFGVEAYWVHNHKDKDSTNNHIVLLAKNENGRKALNRAIAKSYISKESLEKGIAQEMFPEVNNDDVYYYYKNRMDMDLLLSLPKDDIFVTTACIAFWLKYSNDGAYWDIIDNDVLQLSSHFTDFYLEIQANNTESQKMVNEHIMELHNKYGIPIIAGCDSHYISNDQKDDREYLLKSNAISYPEEDGNYMDFPSYDTLVNRFNEQGIVPLDKIHEAIDNTNKILDFDDIVLDRTLKVPVAKMFKDKTQEERNQIFINILKDEWKKQRNDINESLLEEYQKEIKHDINEIISCNMADYFIDDYYIVKRGVEKYNGIITPTGRGSSVSMFLNKLLGLTKVDKVNSPVTMYSERFLTASRILDSKTPPDIDNNISSREPFIKAQRDIIGNNTTFDLIAFGTLKYKSAFKMYSRANEVEPSIANEITKQIDKYENAIKHMSEDETEDDYNIFDYVDKDKYGYLIDGCQKYRGIIDTLKGHPCFTGDALVMTNTGYKKISDVSVGDEVLTIDNDFHKVLNTMNHYADDIYSLNLSSSIDFEVTSNHPFFTARKIKNKSRELSNFKWKEVKDLTKGDLVGVAINQKNTLPQLNFVDSSNKDFWWCLGRYFGDGWRSHTIRRSGRNKGKKIKDVIICCNKKNNETKIITNRLSWCSYRVSENNTTNKIYLKCKELYDWLEQFGDYADGKHFNNTIFDLPKEYLEEFLNGYLSADGYCLDNVYSLTTINKQLAYGIIACVHKVYKTPCNISIRKTSGKETICGRTIKAHPKYIVRFKKYSSPQDSSFFKSGYMWYKYNDKTKINCPKKVYNLEVEGNHTYTVYNYIVHNCATLMYNGNAIEDIGVIMVKSESTKKEVWVALQESATMDSFGLVKNDWLVVDSIGLTYDIYKEIGMTPMTINELLKEIEHDEKTWDIYKNGYTMCINQVEQQKSTEKVMRFKPKNIYELCQFVAGIRPSFQTMYKTLESRTHFDYGIKAFDDLLQDKYCDSSFILYQESLMKVLGFAGFPMGETYTIIKAISKKKKYVIENAKKKFIPNFTKAILDTKETDNKKEAEQTAHKVWKIIEDSASYGFNCLSGKTKLYRDKNGGYAPTIEEMYNIMNDKEYAIKTGHMSLHYKYKNNGYGMCYSLGNDGRIYQNKIIDIYKQPKTLTYKITTKNGRKIIATANHKFPIDEKGNTKVLSELKVGNKLIVKGEYEPTKETYNLTNGDFESNLQKKGEIGFQKKENGAFVVYDKFRFEQVTNKRCCEDCGMKYDGIRRFEVHHVDFNRLHNETKNYAWLCASCHKKRHFKHGRNTKWDKGCPIEYDEIISIEENEIEDVYDVSVSGDVSHTFLIDNGIMTSNCSHSYCMALDSVTLAWLKAHYPYEFYKVTLQRYTDKGDKNKVTKLKKEMSNLGISLKPIKFGDDNRQFSISKDKNYISQTMASIKDMEKVAPIKLYELSSKRHYDNFLQLLFDIKTKRVCDSKSLDILIKLDYFSDFGDINYLLNVVKYYNKYIDNGNFGKTKRKQFRIADLDDVKKYYPFEKETILKFKTEESKNGNTIYVSQENMYKLIVYLCSKLKKNTTTLYDRITYEATLLGYVSITSSDSPYWAVTNVDVNQYGTPFASLYRVSDGLTEVYKVNRQYYKEYGLNTGDIIYPLFNTKNKSIKKDNKWVQTDETYEELSAWKWSD